MIFYKLTVSNMLASQMFQDGTRRASRITNGIPDDAIFIGTDLDTEGESANWNEGQEPDLHLMFVLRGRGRKLKCGKAGSSFSNPIIVSPDISTFGD